MPDILTELSEEKKEGLTKAWLSRIQAAIRREKTYRDQANRVIKLYEGDKADVTPFSIVYSNTEVLQPAIYNQVPTPIVSRRFEDPDPVGKAASETGTRLLKYLMVADSPDYDTYDELVQASVLDGLLTNRGLMRFRFVPHGAYEECVYGEAVRWDKFFHGYARTWKKVPWIGFEWDMTADELKDNFPDVDLSSTNFGESTTDDGGNDEDKKDELQGVNLYKVYEIWDKVSKRVMFFSTVTKKTPLKVVDDPFGLSGFFPIPKPLNFMKKSSTLVPTPLYEHYRQQAQELNEITRRLKAIIKAIRFRGAYNGAVEDFDKMLKAEDNDFIPVQNIQSMGENVGMDKLIWVVPIQELVTTAQSLYQQRESCKQVIYEIMGISDILRGSTVASETATAQQLKSQWGTMRLRKMQKEVQRFCRDAIVIMLEIASAKFEQQTIVQMTGLPYLTNEQKQQIQMQMQQLQQQAAQQAAMMPPAQPGQPPAPPPQPQIPPQLQQLLPMMGLPSWEDIVGVLKNELQRSYKCDIETDSTIDAEESEDKQDIADLFNAMSQFLTAMAPLVQEGVFPMEVAKQMLLVVVRRYKFGSQLEDSLENMQQPQMPPGGGQAAAVAQGKIQLENTKTQNAMQLNQAETASKQQLMQQQQAMQAAEFEQTMAQRQADHEVSLQRLRIRAAEQTLQENGLQLKIRQQQAQHEAKMAQISAQAAAKGE